jgi:hypothetical protein
MRGERETNGSELGKKPSIASFSLQAFSLNQNHWERGRFIAMPSLEL